MTGAALRIIRHNQCFEKQTAMCLYAQTRQTQMAFKKEVSDQISE
jgi:hypothetical protein